MGRGQLSNLGFTILMLVIAAFFLIMGIIMISNVDDTIAFDTLSSSENLLADNASATTLAQTPTTLSATAKNNSWLSFDGVNDYVNLTPYTIKKTDNNYTFSIWVNVTGIGGTSVSTPARNIIRIGLSSFTLNHNLGNAYVNWRNNSPYWVRGTSEINDSQWHHIIVRYDNLTYNVSLWVDGIVENSTLVTPWESQTTDVVQLSDSVSSYALLGWIDEFRIYNKTLSEAEITEIYNSGLVANSSLPTDGLVLWLPLNEGSGTDVHSFNQSDFT